MMHPLVSDTLGTVFSILPKAKRQVSLSQRPPPSKPARLRMYNLAHYLPRLCIVDLPGFFFFYGPTPQCSSFACIGGRGGGQQGVANG
jgi:hypothetical protein